MIPIVALKLKNIGDQDIIKEYYKDRWTEDLWLDHKYNMFSIYIDWYVINENYKLRNCSIYPSNKNNNVKIIHYIGYTKPWMREISRYAVFKMNLKTLFYATLGKQIYKRASMSLYYNYLIKLKKTINETCR